MEFLERIKFVFGIKGPKETPGPNAGVIFVPPYKGGLPASWATDKSEEVKHFKHWAYAAISAIASRIAAAQLHLYVQKGKDSEEVFAHPFIDLLYRVNPFKTKFDLWWETIMFLELTGDAYWYLAKNKLGLPAEIWVCPSNYMKIVGSIREGVQRYEYRLPGAAKPTRFEAEEILHFRYPSPVDMFYGYSPLRAAAEAIDTYESAKTTQFNAFRNGIYPGGILATDQKLKDETIERIRNSIVQKYGGEEKAGKIFILEQGLKFSKISLTPQEMDFAESSKILRDEILGIFKVPAAIAGLSEDVNRASADALEVIFARNTVEPKLRMIEDAINQSLLPVFDENLWCEFEPVLPKDAESEAKQMEIRLRTGLTTVNEERRKRGLGPVKWGDEPWVPRRDPEESSRKS